MTISYDKPTDTLYLATSDLRDSVVRDLGHGILVQVRRATQEPVGVIVHDFEARFSKRSDPCQVPLLQPA